MLVLIYLIGRNEIVGGGREEGKGKISNQQFIRVVGVSSAANRDLETKQNRGLADGTEVGVKIGAVH